MSTLNKIKVLILMVALFWCIAPVQGLTEQSEISVLTYEPGNELYTIFGHTALRVKDSALQIDDVYNFGTFDFSSPFFYMRFFGGRLDYFLTIIDYQSFLHYSVTEQRTVYEQTLSLSVPEREAIYAKLQHTYNSDERFYKYDFFYDNCATRVRDMVNISGSVFSDVDTAKFCCKTFRELLKPFVSNNYWVDFGVNVALGKEADKIASTSDFMYLPEYIYLIINDSERGSKTATVIDLSAEADHKNDYSILVFVLLLLFVVLPQTRAVSFYTVSVFLSLLGVFLLGLSIVSDNSAFQENLNILWTLPSLVVMLTKQKIRKVVEYIFLIWLITLLIFRQAIYLGFSDTYIPWIVLLAVMYIVDLQIEKQAWVFVRNIGSGLRFGVERKL